MKWKYSGNESYMQEHIPKPVNSVGHGGFLQDVSITFILMENTLSELLKWTIGHKVWKHIHALDLKAHCKVWDNFWYLKAL